MAVYLLHFDKKYRHAQHYLGYAGNLEQRLKQHKSGTGARLMEVIRQAGITWQVVRVWPDGTRELERKLKGWHSGTLLCPICQTVAQVRRWGFDMTIGEIEALFRDDNQENHDYVKRG